MHVSVPAKRQSPQLSMARLSFMAGIILILMLNLSSLQADQISSVCLAPLLDQQTEDDSGKKKEDESSDDSEDEDDDDDDEDEDEEPDCE